MKKLMILPLVAIAMVACGDKEKGEEDNSSSAKIGVCDCVKAEKEMREKMSGIDMTDEKAVAALEEEYEDLKNSCENLMQEKEKEIKALPEEEQEEAAKAMWKEIEECGSM